MACLSDRIFRIFQFYQPIPGMATGSYTSELYHHLAGDSQSPTLPGRGVKEHPNPFRLSKGVGSLWLPGATDSRFIVPGLSETILLTRGTPAQYKDQDDNEKNNTSNGSEPRLPKVMQYGVVILMDLICPTLPFFLTQAFMSQCLARFKEFGLCYVEFIFRQFILCMQFGQCFQVCHSIFVLCHFNALVKVPGFSICSPLSAIPPLVWPILFPRW